MTVPVIRNRAWLRMPGSVVLGQYKLNTGFIALILHSDFPDHSVIISSTDLFNG
jgi:hypothetical protein